MSSRTFPSSLLVAVGLAAGFGIAQGTGIRALGGAVFAAAGLAAGVLWLRRRNQRMRRGHQHARLVHGPVDRLAVRTSIFPCALMTGSSGCISASAAV